MNRSSDLDQIAPDDPVVTPENKSKSIPSSKPKISQSINQEKTYQILGGHSKHPLSSFLINPKNISFSEQDNDEEILLAMRPHWANNLGWISLSILMLFIPFLLSFSKLFGSLPSEYRFSSILFWYLFTFIYTFEKFLTWYFNVFFITNQRVVDIDFNNMLNKHFAEAELSAVQDVSSSVKGLLGTFFNYGDVLIQTAAEINQINFEKVANPEKVIKLLKELRLEDNQIPTGGTL